ncbi:hypothetical protein TWF696_003257 [Orbilia brochopaga]|uniref:F-box domain-containing protein n=1 Tax=Orbilia brochopaga TaxID=3140254 RepID=A0AAV9TYM7_9PEZI
MATQNQNQDPSLQLSEFQFLRLPVEIQLLVIGCDWRGFPAFSRVCSTWRSEVQKCVSRKVAQYSWLYSVPMPLSQPEGTNVFIHRIFSVASTWNIGDYTFTGVASDTAGAVSDVTRRRSFMTSNMFRDPALWEPHPAFADITTFDPRWFQDDRMIIWRGGPPGIMRMKIASICNIFGKLQIPALPILAPMECSLTILQFWEQIVKKLDRGIMNLTESLRNVEKLDEHHWPGTGTLFVNLEFKGHVACLAFEFCDNRRKDEQPDGKLAELAALNQTVKTSQKG